MKGDDWDISLSAPARQNEPTIRTALTAGHSNRTGRRLMPGVFITKGMTVGIPPGGLKLGIGADGRPTGQLELHVRFDVCPTWVALALRHVDEARRGREARIIAWSGDDESAKGASLETEFESSMQAVMAAAIAIDAFYSMIQPHVRIPEATVETWRTKRTARYSQVAEVIRRGFGLKRIGVQRLRQNLKEIYRLRDLAVHPSGRIEAPVLHPDLDVGVEWRFVYFRADNAELVVNAATWTLWELSHSGRPDNPEIRRYVDGLRLVLDSIFPAGHPFDQRNSAVVAAT